MSIIQLSIGEVELSIRKNESKDRIDVETLILHPGTFQSHLGPVDVAADTLLSLADNYNNEFNGFIARAKQKMLGACEGVELKEIELTDAQLSAIDHRVPIQIDHDLSNTKTIGRMVGPVRIEDKDGIPHLYGTLSLRGEENVQRVKDGRFKHVSLGYNEDTCKIQEVSFVTYGACPSAGVMMAADGDTITDGTDTTVATINGDTVVPGDVIAIQRQDPVVINVAQLQNSVTTDLQLQAQVEQINQLQQKLKLRTEKTAQLADLQVKARSIEASYKTLQALSAMQKKGQIMPYQLKTGLVDDILSLDSESQEKVTKVLSRLLKPQIELGVQSSNVAAMKAYDLLNENIKFGDEEVKMKLQGNLEQAFRKFAKGKDATTELGYNIDQYPNDKGGVIHDGVGGGSHGEHGSSPKMPVSFDHVKKAHAMLESGDVEGAKKYLSELMKEEEDDETEMSAAEAKALKAKVAELLAEQAAVNEKMKALMAEINKE